MLANVHLITVYVWSVVLDMLDIFEFIVWIIFTYLKTPPGVLGNCGLEFLRDILSTPTKVSFDCLVIHLPSDRG